MPQVLTSEVSQIRAERCSNGGWVVFKVEGPIYRITESSPMAACSDDEALLEWLASQFGLPAPAPEIDALKPTRFQGFANIPMRDIDHLRKVLAPLHDLVDRLSHLGEGTVLETDAVDLDGQRVVVSLDGLRAMVRAADPIVMELPF